MALPIHRVSAAILVFCAWAAAGDTPLRVRGIEGRVAIYATTNSVREAVAWVPSETELAVCGELPDESVWVRVVPPEQVSVWVYRELVNKGVVLSDKVRVRSGAGLNYHPVGSLNKGEHVDVRGTYGDWIKIKPPTGVAFWVLRDCVEPLAVTPPEGEYVATNLLPVVDSGAPATNALSATAVAVSTNAAALTSTAGVAQPPELSGYVLLASSDQGARVFLSGILDWGMVGAVAAPYCLIVRQPNGDTVPVCHVVAFAALANPNVGSAVAIEGTRWRVKDSDLPVVVAATIRLVE